jgi:hypothetical protein
MEPRRAHGELKQITSKFSAQLRHELRRSYGCDCDGDRWRGARVVTTPIDRDPGERNHKMIDDATGVYPIGCPWRSIAHPFVRAVMTARKHWSKGAISVEDMPHVLRTGLEIFDAAVSSIEVTDMRKDREDREAERRKREATKSTPSIRRR